MAQQFNAIIATQTDHFRGTSAVEILDTTTALPNFRAITGAVYGLNITGGVSGTFSVHVLGSIGGTTYIVAGLTGIASFTSNDTILYPATYASSGAMNGLETAVSAATQQIDQIVPPSVVVFESDVATAGVSANCTVSAVLYANR